SRLLAKEGVRHEVLNAKNHAREASIVAQAGRKGAVTVATNMAGRGTDIMLGGNAEFTAVAELAQRGLDPEENSEEYEAAWPAAFEAAKQSVKDEHEEVLNLGGLYVLGTERHESRRIDNQLRGRSGRQGDPGESRFYLSLTDDLMRLFNSGAAERLMNSSVPDDVALESKLVSRAIASAQGQVEGRNAEQRKNVLKYDDVLNRQREAIYGDRRRILEGDDLHEKVQYFIEDTINAFIDEATAEGNGDDWDFNLLWSNLKTLYPVSFTPRDVIDEAGGKSRITVEFLKEEILSDARLVYQAREELIGSESMRELERRVVLSVIGRKWQEHLYEMDYLKEGIGLRAMAQRDPLVEYQREGFTMFQAMMEAIREESVGFLYNLDVEVTPAQDVVVADEAGQHTEHQEPQIHAAGLEAPEKPAQLQYTAPGEDGAAQTRVEAKSSGRSGNPAKAAQESPRRATKKKRR
ncbi:MAG TPA: preprotein translocase subunit SecA, partial [Arthrobacter sp.]|nr:preprotein translocase subunit SecA [Arthrobacter sp.]